jgi:hypothetical protein
VFAIMAFPSVMPLMFLPGVMFHFTAFLILF